jgi:hypothetical protein
MDTHQVDVQQIDLHHESSRDTVHWSFGTACLVCNEPVVLFYGAPKTRQPKKRRIICNRCRKVRSDNEPNNRTNLIS